MPLLIGESQRIASPCRAISHNDWLALNLYRLCHPFEPILAVLRAKRGVTAIINHHPNGNHLFIASYRYKKPRQLYGQKSHRLAVYSPLNWVKYCAFMQSFPYPAPITRPVTARTSVTPRPGYIFPACLLMRESFMFEVNPVLNKLKELSERTELLRGYL